MALIPEHEVKKLKDLLNTHCIYDAPMHAEYEIAIFGTRKSEDGAKNLERKSNYICGN